MTDNSNVPIVATGDFIDAAFINQYWGDNMAARWPYTAKGDIAVAIGANTLIALPVGANNKLLVADSTQSSGMKWDYNFVPLTTKKNSTNWNGSSKTIGTYTVALTEFDAAYTSGFGIRAVLISLAASWAAASAGSLVNIHPPSSTGNGLLVRSLVAGFFIDNSGIVPTSAGNIEIIVAGASATVYVDMWGYWL
jgi:hypothetical protein